jgi:hypothetical protein
MFIYTFVTMDTTGQTLIFLQVVLSAYKPLYGALFEFTLVKRFRLYKCFRMLCYENQYGSSSSKVLECLAANIGQSCQQKTSRKRYECFQKCFYFGCSNICMLSGTKYSGLL